MGQGGLQALTHLRPQPFTAMMISLICDGTSGPTLSAVGGNPMTGLLNIQATHL